MLTDHGAALPRTLEQKISDAGPSNLRVDPHVVTTARAMLVKRGRIEAIPLDRAGPSTAWFHLKETSPTVVAKRIEAQKPTYLALQKGKMPMRIGQALEIAVYRALQGSGLMFFGAFHGLDQADDSTLYKKEEPPRTISGATLPAKMLVDFVVIGADGNLAAIEIKNVREWMYPDRNELRDLARKSCVLNAVPVLIARRIPYVTLRLLTICGFILHEQYNQLLPASANVLAAQAADKDLLGFHDIRLGNEPDERLSHFIQTNLPAVLPEAREKFDEYKDLVASFGEGMPYQEFAARVRRRTAGTNEDFDSEEGL